MKKILFSLFVFTCFAFSAYAQNIQPQVTAKKLMVKSESHTPKIATTITKITPSTAQESPAKSQKKNSAGTIKIQKPSILAGEDLLRSTAKSSNQKGSNH